MDRLSEEQLMEGVQRGQTNALDELYRRYARKLTVFCMHATRSTDPQEPEELGQDVFIRVIKAAATFNPRKASFRTCMFRIARNRCDDLVAHRNKAVGAVA